MMRVRLLNASVMFAGLSFAPTLSAQTPGTVPALARQVEVRRTAYGVPHIKAENLSAAYYALAYLQLEDYGPSVAMGLLRARGEMGKWFGRDSMESDFTAQIAHRKAIEFYPKLEQATRDAYDGFAVGVNRYIELHPEEFPAGFAPHFTGYDVATRDIDVATPADARRFLARMDPTARRGRGATASGQGEGDEPPQLAPGEDPPDEGSNAWAFAPSRTKSGKAILIRNPHLQWNAGYYEGQMSVPGVVEYYGDFRIGGPFGVIGGFNRDLGWSTTNNAPELSQIYALDVDSARVDHYLMDGASLPLDRELVTVQFKNGNGISSETREIWRTPLGPVIYRGNGKIYVAKVAGDGDFRGGEQFLHMMRAKSLAEWKDAMRIRARVNSNFTYADRAGNIFYVWNASIPSLPLPSGGDSVAIPVHRMADVWTRYVPFDSLPQVLNPKGGYVQNSNDPPYLTNLRQPLDRAKYPANFPDQTLSLRTQLSLDLIDNNKKLSLEDAIALKHSYRMLLGDRVRDDLVAAVRATTPTGDVAKAIGVIAAWDKTAAPTSRGGVLFEVWWRKYVEGTSQDTMYAHPWTMAEPTTTPRGLKNPSRAAEAFAWAVTETARRYGSFDVPWGEVHRARVGKVDVPIGGCHGNIGCFRVLWFKDDPDGKRSVQGGDGWILAIEFGDQPRAYSVLAYGESTRLDSPHHDDQTEMFAKAQMKPVLWLDADVEKGTVVRYRPGEKK